MAWMLTTSVHFKEENKEDRELLKWLESKTEAGETLEEVIKKELKARKRSEKNSERYIRHLSIINAILTLLELLKEDEYDVDADIYGMSGVRDEVQELLQEAIEEEMEEEEMGE